MKSRSLAVGNWRKVPHSCGVSLNPFPILPPSALWARFHIISTWLFAMSYHLVSYDINRFDIVLIFHRILPRLFSSRLIISHFISSHHISSHRVSSCLISVHLVLSHLESSHPIISHHVASGLIMSHHVSVCFIMSHHVSLINVDLWFINVRPPLCP